MVSVKPLDLSSGFVDSSFSGFSQVLMHPLNCSPGGPARCDRVPSRCRVLTRVVGSSAESGAVLSAVSAGVGGGGGKP